LKEFHTTYCEEKIDDYEREREREFIDTNIKQFHAKIKLRPWDTEKNCKKGCLVGRPSKVS